MSAPTSPLSNDDRPPSPAARRAKHLDQQQILAYLAVAEAGSFSAAARRLHLTQPALSKRVALLEDQLGFLLFERLPKRLELTEAGQALLPAARRLRQALDDFAELPPKSLVALTGRLSIALSHYTGLHRLPAALEAFNQAHPGVLLDLRFVESETALALVLQGEVRLAYGTLGEPDDRLVVDELWQEQLIPMGATRQVTEEPEAFWRSHPMILPAARTSTRQLIDDWLRQIQLKPAAVIEVNQLDSIALLVGTGIGWSVLPHSLQNDKIRPIPSLNASPAQRRLGGIRLANRPLSPAAAAFIATVVRMNESG
ncbi:LysR family transcriptional regulator [Halothiobacillus sp. DCM-1]|uniref:LysR family transcriptional regulator n=1 Tax=Halothiobacillus sp. DCM-1 TaxID=3112558 RepID=UPI00324B2E35